MLSIAGLWDQWKDPETGEAIPSRATLIVTSANDFTRRIVIACRSYSAARS